MKKSILFAILTSIAVPAIAQEVPYILGPDGGLHRGINPSEYFNGLDEFPNKGTQEWCFWPLGCWGSQDPEISPDRPGPNFNPRLYSFEQFEALQGQSSLSINVIPINPNTLQYLEE